MWNAIFHEHKQQSPNCSGIISWDLRREQAWREIAVCSKCSYSSDYFNMYEEEDKEERGRKGAKVNIGLQVGHTHTPISTNSFQELCLRCNIPCPSTTGKQCMANKVAEKIQKASEENLIQQQQKLSEINRLRGNNPNVVNIQADCIYNNVLDSSVGKTPFLPATQCAYTVAKNNTSKHQVIGAVIKEALLQCKKTQNCHKLKWVFILAAARQTFHWSEI